VTEATWGDWLGRVWAELDRIDTPGTLEHTFWALLVLTGMVLFYGRFYVQWIVSEIRGRSVIPVAFWYMSSVGSVIMFSYGVHTASANGALSHCFNILVYARNLVHIWRRSGKLTPLRSLLVHGLVAVIAGISLSLLVYTWFVKYEVILTESAGTVHVAWFWVILGVVGQGLFACRFLLQWLVSESQQKSVVPVAFWYISVAAALLLSTSHFMQEEWVYCIGVGATIGVYIRNIFLHRKGLAVVE